MSKTHSHFCIILLLLFYIHAFNANAAELAKQSDIIAITGDSITYGGYPLLIEAYLNMCETDGPVRIVQYGWPGDSLTSFWGRPCGANPILATKPSVVTTLYGMNDTQYNQVTENTIKWYKNGLQRLIDTYRENGVKTIIIGSPTAVDTYTYKAKNGLDAIAFNQSLGTLGDAAKEVAQQNQCNYVDIHHLILDVMKKAKAKYGDTYHVMGTDGVHPRLNGNLIIAYAFLKALGCSGNIGQITVDLANHTAHASQGHRVITYTDNSLRVQSTKYPFCFKGNPQDPNATSGIIEFLSFNADLNRFILTVKNTPLHSRFKVTWGTQAKEFNAEELSNGINLADEFLDNPFTESFAKIYWVIMDKKCKWEHRQYIHMLARLPKLMYDMSSDQTTLKPDVQNDIRQLLKVDPNANQSMGQLSATVIKKDSQLADEVSSMIQPVDHSITIELITKN